MGGSHIDEETAAFASDTLARTFMANGEKGHKLNFPNDDIEMYSEYVTSSRFIGVTYNKVQSKWRVQRRSNSKVSEKDILYNGSYSDEETAAHASDTLARDLIARGGKYLKLNFPHDETEVQGKRLNKRKRLRNKSLKNLKI